jgi:hypothetical protein
VAEKEAPQEPHISAAVPAGSDLLTEGQRRNLGTVLRRMEWAVWQMEELLMQDQLPELTLTRLTNAPDVFQLDALFRLARCVRQNVSSLAFEYGIPVEEEDQMRKLHALFTLLWVDLEDVRPEKLGRYGAVHPQLKEQLGPQVQRLVDLTLALAEAVNGTRDPRAVQSLAEACSDYKRPGASGSAGERSDGVPPVAYDKEE